MSLGFSVSRKTLKNPLLDITIYHSMDTNHLDLMLFEYAILRFHL